MSPSLPEPLAPPYRAVLGDRGLFPHLEARAYLNHAGISPASEPVRAVVRTLVDDYARKGAAAWVGWGAQRNRLKEKLARLLTCRPEDLGFVPSTTAGVMDVALCFPWTRGDRVVGFQGEFPANVTPWQQAAALHGLELELLPLPDPREGLEGFWGRLDQALSRGVRLVAVSAVQFSTGQQMPLAELSRRCHAAGAQLFVDAVQACGAVPLDVTALELDYLACGSHKWMMGLEGAGFLYVSPHRVGELRPAVAGWLSHEGGLPFLGEGPGHLRYDRPIRRRVDFVEGGNLNATGLAALEASLDCLQQVGIENIYTHVNRYLDALEQGLTARGLTSLRAPDPSRRGCALGVLPPAGRPVVELHKALLAQGIACSIPDGVLRFAPHWPNPLAEVDLVLAAVDQALR